MRFGQNLLRMAWKARFVQFFIQSLLFSSIRVNFSPVERIFDLKRWKMRFAQNVLRIAWKARFVQFSWKAYCFHVLALISVPWAIFGFGTFKNAIWSKHPPHGLKSTFCSIFIQSLLFSSISVTLSPVKRFFGSKTLKNAIWPKRPPHCLKSTFCTIFMESLLFSRIGVNFGPLSNFWIWNVEKCDLAKTSSCLKSTFSTILMKSLLVSRIGVNFCPVERFWLWNVEKCDLVKTSSAWPEKHVLYNFYTKPTVFTYWREFQSGRAIFWSKTLKIAILSKRPPHGLKSTFCTIFIQSLLFSRIGVNFGPLSNFWIWNVEKCDLVKTSSAWPEKHVLYNFDGKPTVFTYSREFPSGRAIFWSKTLKNAIWPKRPPDGLKSTFCTIFMKSLLLFSRIGLNFSPAERFLDLKRWKMRFGENVLRMAWKARFLQFSYKAYSFHVLALISVPWAIFGFGTLKNAIWPKRPPHGLKSTFCTIFIQSLLFSSIGVNFSPV